VIEYRWPLGHTLLWERPIPYTDLLRITDIAQDGETVTVEFEVGYDGRAWHILPWYEDLFPLAFGEPPRT
jgi:hypothetical protein